MTEEIRLPKQLETCPYILSVLNKGGSMRSRIMAERVRDIHYRHLPPHSLNKTDRAGRQLILQNILLGTLHLRKAKMVVYPRRGIIEITPKGKQALENNILFTSSFFKNDKDYIEDEEQARIKKEQKENGESTYVRVAQDRPTTSSVRDRIIYVVQNPAIRDFIKIGTCLDKGQMPSHIKQLSRKGIPMPYYLLKVFEVPDAKKLEKDLRQTFPESVVEMDQSFYKSGALNKLLLWMDNMGREINVAPLNKQILDGTQGGNIKPVAAKSQARMPTFNFEMVKVPSGATLNFIKDTSITCNVIDRTNVLFMGKQMKLSVAARDALAMVGTNWKSARGSDWWTYKGEILTDRKERMGQG